MKTSRRQERLDESIKRIIGGILHEEMFRDDAMISVTEINVSPDIQWVDVSLSIYPYEKHGEIMKILGKRVGFFQSLFNKQLRIRHTPKIRFKLDSRLEAGIIEGT